MTRAKKAIMIFLRKFFNILLTKEFASAFESCLIIIGIIGAISYLPTREIVHIEYVGNVVTGFATSGGIIAAFSGFWLAHLNTTSPEVTKKWLRKRIAVIVPFIGLCLFFVFAGLFQLVFGSLESAVNFSALGIALLILLVAEVSYITFYQGYSTQALE